MDTNPSTAVVAAPRAVPALTLFIRTAAVALVVVLPLVFTPWGSDAYQHPKVLVLYGLAAAAVVGWMALYLVARRPRWRVTIPELALWFFLLAVLLSSWTSVNARLTFFGAPGRYEGLFAICSYVALYFVGVHFFGSHGGLRLLATAAGAAAVAAIGYGLLQVFIPPLFAGEAFIREWYAGAGMPRIPSALGSPVVFGGYLSLMLLLLLALALSATGRARAVWLAAACLGYVASALTSTRAAWLAVAVGTCALLAAIGRDAWRRYRIVIAIVAGGIILFAGVLFAVTGSPERITARVASSVDVGSGSLAQRLYLWDRTLTLIRSRPWLGWGLETLREIFPYDRPSLVRYFGPRPVIIDKAHNDVLQVAVSIGVPGAIAYVVFWGLLVAAAVRTWRREAGSSRILAAGWLAAVIAYLIQVQFSFSTVALAPLVWLMAGAAVGWEATNPREGNAGTREL